MNVRHEVAYRAPFATLQRQRTMARDWFGQAILSEPGARGRVLDVGCGGALPTLVAGLPDVCQQLDGVDPSPSIEQHPQLTQRWRNTVEQADLPAASYDLAYAHYVLEHIPHPRPFFEKLRRVLKPGGVFWGYTPHARHPFTLGTRAVQALGIKGFLARRKEGLNDYPSYYRANAASAVLAAIDGLGYESATFYYLPAVSWHHYFPRPLRFVPISYDWALGTRRPGAMLILAVRLEVAR